MAIAYLTPSTAPSFDLTLVADSTTSVTADGGTGSERIMVVAMLDRNSSGVTISDITFEGVSLDPVDVSVENTQCRQRIWTLTSTDGLATGEGTLEVTVTGGFGSNPNAAISFLVFDGVDQTTPYDGYNSASGTDATAELTISSGTDEVPLMLSGFRGATATSSAPTNYTERYDNVANSAMIAAGGEGVGDTSVAFVSTFSSAFPTSWVAQGLNLLPAAAAAGLTPRLALLGAG